MAEFRKQSGESRDYKERFEFELTVGGNIICQRYFRINNYNPTSLRSYELTDAIRQCVAIIDRDLKDKTHAYLEMYSPLSFDTVEKMEEYFKDAKHCSYMRTGEGIIVRNSADTDYVWTSDNTFKPLGYKFDDGELTNFDAEANKVEYKFAFKVDGREACSMVWNGYYPKFVRDKIDLSNKRGKFDNEDISRLSFEQYLLYKMVQGKSDLVYGLIKNICYTCSYGEDKAYSTKVNDILNGWKNSSQRNLWRLD